MSSPPRLEPERLARDPYRELFERSADAILIIEGETFIDCNDATVRMLRYASKEEVLQTHPSELSPPKQPDGRDSFEKANEMIAIAFERGSHRFEWDHRRADGEVFPVEVLLTAVSEPGRRTLHVVWRDITERKSLEERLRQAQKMEAIGQLTGGIAHDFNNLLVVILGHASLLAETVVDRSEELEHAREICDASERAADLVRQLLAFGRKQQLLPAPLDLNELIRNTEKLLGRMVGEAVELVPALSTEPIPVKVDRTQLEQVLLNLAANARDALPDGGRLTLATSQESLAGARLATHGLPAGEYAVLRVSDDGCGMSADTAARAFEPFFTTKAAGRGSGLGLATVYGIVSQSGGAASLRSAPGEGTTVEILLPVTGEPLPSDDVLPSEPARAVGGSETVLVVEDEAAVARFVAQALEDRGYRVLSAWNGREALELYHRQRHEIDLVVTDVIMPTLGGPQLVRELERTGHPPPVLFMSGYTDQGLSHLHGLERDVDVLHKPFNVRELVTRVRRALDRARQA